MQSKQMRAISSPSLSENPLEIIKYDKKNHQHDENLHINETHQSNLSASVLQKFKKTFSHLKGKSTTATTGNALTIAPSNLSVHTVAATLPLTMSETLSNDTAKYRFGPLIWRSSKERRKTKHHRRDKCNSGDSGIQVELDNDDGHMHDMVDSTDTSPSFNVRVRRANSAKVTSNTTLMPSLKLKAVRKNDTNDRLYATATLPGRSLSQPYGLNQIVRRKYIILFHLSR